MYKFFENNSLQNYNYCIYSWEILEVGLVNISDCSTKIVFYTQTLWENKLRPEVPVTYSFQHSYWCTTNIWLSKEVEYNLNNLPKVWDLTSWIKNRWTNELITTDSIKEWKSWLLNSCKWNYVQEFSYELLCVGGIVLLILWVIFINKFRRKKL